MKKSIKKRNWCFIVYPTKEQLDHPYAFLVLVENGGSGSSAAGDVAARVLNALVSP